LEDLPAAAEWLRQAYLLRPDMESGYWYGRALALGAAPQEGVKVLETAATAADGDPLLPWILRDLAVGYARSGQCAAAEDAFTRAAAADPSAENQARIATARREYGDTCIPQ
jgi:hypothetical protein